MSLVRLVMEERRFAKRIGIPFGGPPILLLEEPPELSWNLKVLVKDL
jgi:hypothetical protein